MTAPNIAVVLGSLGRWKELDRRAVGDIGTFARNSLVKDAEEIRMNDPEEDIPSISWERWVDSAILWYEGVLRFYLDPTSPSVVEALREAYKQYRHALDAHYSDQERRARLCETHAERYAINCNITNVNVPLCSARDLIDEGRAIITQNWKVIDRGISTEIHRKCERRQRKKGITREEQAEEIAESAMVYIQTGNNRTITMEEALQLGRVQAAQYGDYIPEIKLTN